MEVSLKNRLKPSLRQSQNMHSSSSLYLFVRLNKDKNRFASYVIGLEPAATAQSYDSLGWNIKAIVSSMKY
jgi:hypothetical protein